jgi:hypothetical protein
MKTVSEMAREANVYCTTRQSTLDAMLERFAALVAKETLAQSKERNFCQRCGKRTADPTTIHTCTPPIAIGSRDFYGLPNKPVSASNADGKCVTAGETAP